MCPHRLEQEYVHVCLRLHKYRCRCSSFDWWVCECFHSTSYSVTAVSAYTAHIKPSIPPFFPFVLHSPLSSPFLCFSFHWSWVNLAPRSANSQGTVRRIKVSHPKQLLSAPWSSTGRIENQSVVVRAKKGSSCSYATARIAFIHPHFDRKFNNYPRAQLQNMISMDPDDNGFYMQLRQRGNYPVYGNNGAWEWDNCLLVSVVVGRATGNLLTVGFNIRDNHSGTDI